MRQIMGFPGGSDSTDSACSVGDPGSIPGLGTHSSILFFFFLPSSILASRIPWTEEPGRLQFMGSQTVGHD